MLPVLPTMDVGSYASPGWVHIDAKNPEEAARRFKDLRDRQAEIEAAYGDKLSWEILKESRGHRIASYYPEGVRVGDCERWSDLRAWSIDGIGPFTQALQPYIDTLLYSGSTLYTSPPGHRRQTLSCEVSPEHVEVCRSGRWVQGAELSPGPR